METNDVFAFLRALDNGAGADSVDTAIGGTAPTAEPDIFAGSEPVETTPPPESQPAAAEPVTTATTTFPVTYGTGAAVPAAVATTKDVTATLISAITDLHERLARVEAYLRQNGVL